MVECSDQHSSTRALAPAAVQAGACARGAEEDLGGSCSFLSGFRVGATVTDSSKNERSDESRNEAAANEACVSAFLEVALPQALAQVKREVDQQEQRDEAQGR